MNSTQEKVMRKYTGIIVIAMFLLAILIGTFWHQIIKVDAITIGVFIIFSLFCLAVLVRSLFYKNLNWSKPGILLRPFLPPIDEEKPHFMKNRNEAKSKERQED